MKNNRYGKQRRISVPKMPVGKPQCVSAKEMEEMLGMSHEEFLSAQAELVKKGFIEIVEGDITDETVKLRVNFF